MLEAEFLRKGVDHAEFDVEAGCVILVSGKETIHVQEDFWSSEEEV